MIRLRVPLAFRIWAVSAASVIAVGTAVILAFRLLAIEPRPPFRGERYVVEHLAERWQDPAALREEVRRIHRLQLAGVAAYDLDGALRAGEAPGPAPDAALRARVAAEGEVPLGECARGPCRTAYRAGPATAPLGVVVLTPPGAQEPRGLPLLPLALTLLGLALAAIFLGASLARPLQRLADAARRLGSGDLAARTGLRRADELGEVARAFDEMAERLVATLRGQTELLANVAHELRTPLARIRVALDLAEEGDAAAARAALAEIAEDLGELERLVADILASARLELSRDGAASGAPPLHLAPLDLAEVARGAAERLRQRHPDRAVETSLAGPLPVEGDAALLRRVLDNLLDNARKYSPPGSPIRVVARTDALGASVAVADEGTGIAPEDLARLFTPFFRADRSRARATGGVGLGLSLSRRIAEAHGGRLTAASAPGRGSTFTLTLPARAPTGPAASSQSATRP